MEVKCVKKAIQVSSLFCSIYEYKESVIDVKVRSLLTWSLQMRHGSLPASVACGKAWQQLRADLSPAGPPGKILITHISDILLLQHRKEVRKAAWSGSVSTLWKTAKVWLSLYRQRCNLEPLESRRKLNPHEDESSYRTHSRQDHRGFLFINMQL